MEKYAFVRRTSAGVPAVLALSLLCSGQVVAQAQHPPYEGYITDQNGRPVKDSYGHCWKSQFWTPANAIPECDPDLVPKPAAAQGPAPKEPPPPPVAAPAPAPLGPERPAFERVTLQSESLFDFDKATLREGEKRELDEVAAKMKAAPQVEAIQITGHTDRLGSDEYNMRLSQRRADAVKAYLVSKGIDANRIQTVAKGKTQPFVAPGEAQPVTAKCKGERKTAKLIACLQPDRRTELEVKVQRPTQAPPAGGPLPGTQPPAKPGASGRTGDEAPSSGGDSSVNEPPEGIREPNDSGAQGRPGTNELAPQGNTGTEGQPAAPDSSGASGRPGEAPAETGTSGSQSGTALPAPGSGGTGTTEDNGSPTDGTTTR